MWFSISSWRSLNIDKYKIVPATNKQSIINFPCVIDGTPLLRVDSVEVLGVTFDRRFTFNEHVIQGVCHYL